MQHTTSGGACSGSLAAGAEELVEIEGAAVDAEVELDAEELI